MTERELQKVFHALSDPIRLRMVRLLLEYPEVCVCQFQNIFGTYQPRISFHLRVLRDAGIVESKRRGKWVYYGIKHLPECVRQMISTLPLEERLVSCTPNG
uniref:ArsR family transcriptional regulator n=1 Tax=Hydrogenobacter sp. TaxID=2152829 RepID=A0A7C2V4D8_9AQUI